MGHLTWILCRTDLDGAHIGYRREMTMEQILINLVAGTLGRIGCSDQPHAKSSDKVVGYSGVDLRDCDARSTDLALPGM